jgi:uncharacterized damage-inducible protein DinB
MTDIDRTDPPLRAGEADTLLGYLDYHRDTLRQKTYDLTADQLHDTLPPSTMTLGGMLKHLALVESWWFNEVFLGNPEIEPWASVDWDADADWDWHSAVDDTPEHLHALFDSATSASDEIIRSALADGGLDRLSVQESRRGEGAFSLRWIIVHMIEEYARHNGHADLLRESIDGVTGE